MIVRRISIVPFIQKNHWFADEIGLCVALVLYLWECKNFVWLFERMLLSSTIWNLKIRYCFHKSPPLILILSSSVLYTLPHPFSF
jgi:hypothetical protein